MGWEMGGSDEVCLKGREKRVVKEGLPFVRHDDVIP